MPLESRLGGELVNLGNPFKVTNLYALLSSGLTLVLLIGAMVVFVCLLWGGYQWMTAGSDQPKLETAKQRLTQCLVGFAILATSYAIALLVQYFLGINVLQPLPVSIWSPSPPAPAPPPPGPPGGGGGTPCSSTQPCAECFFCDTLGTHTCTANPGAGCGPDCRPGTCGAGGCNPGLFLCGGQPCNPTDPADPCTVAGGVCTGSPSVCNPPAPPPTPTPTPTPPCLRNSACLAGQVCGFTGPAFPSPLDVTGMCMQPVGTWSGGCSNPAGGTSSCISDNGKYAYALRAVWGTPCAPIGAMARCVYNDCRSGSSPCNPSNLGSPYAQWDCFCQ